MSNEMPDGYPFKLPTPASSIIARFGFSQAEAAAFYGVRLDTVKKWMSGKMDMPDGLLAASYMKLSELASIADFIAERYCDQATNNETGEHMPEQYISLPTPNQLLRGTLPWSKGFFDVFFADIASRCYGAGEGRFCFVTPCEPEEEIGDTNLWLVPWYQRGLIMDRCVELEDDVFRFDASFYDFLRAALINWKTVAVQLPTPSKTGVSWGDDVRLEIPYVPDWYDEDDELTEKERALINTTVVLSVSLSGNSDFSDLTSFLPQCLHFVEDGDLRPMMEAFESETDADLNATNENIAQILREVFGTRSKFRAQVEAPK